MKRENKSILKGIYKFLRGVYRILPIPHSAKTSLKNGVRKLSDKLYYLLTGENIAEKYIVIDSYIKDISNIGNRCDDYVEYKENNIDFDENDVKPIAFYLPQFHAIPENDEWWGKGFTEWTNVTKSMPLYPGHYQPHLPLESFYDLSDINVMKNQVELAKNYGIYGFCFHYYWFSGRRLLEKPIENYLSTKEGLDFPFCINWANHNWTRVWDTSVNDMLIEQKHSEEDDLACIADICRYVKDERYIRVNGKPLISIYNPGFMPDANKTIKIWREYCRQNGIGEIHLIGVDAAIPNPMIYNFDGGIAQSPHDINDFYNPVLQDFQKEIPSIDGQTMCRIKDMKRYVDEKMYLKDGRDNLYPGVITSFDNSPRRKSGLAHVLSVSPKLYRKWLYDVLGKSERSFEKGNRLVFINAWNEWAEGMHLEPDRKYGYAYLQATADTVLESRTKDEAICYFDHDKGGGANRYLDKLIEEKQDSYYFIIRYNNEQEQYNIKVVCNGSAYVIHMPSMQDVVNFISQRNTKKIIVNNLYSYPQIQDTLKQITKLKNDMSIKLVYNVHDYFSVCPVYYLLDENNRYCGLSGFSSCKKCVKKCSGEPKIYGYDYIGISDWRAGWCSFLRECNSIITFSNDSKKILEAIHGALPQVIVTPHKVEYIKATKEKSKTAKTLNICFPGHIVKYKGLEILYEMMNLVERKYPEIKLINIGYTDLPIESKFLIQTGRYEPDELSLLTQEYDIDIIFIPSICPETFSYTTQEAIEMNMPVACFDLGAQAERVKVYEKGLIIPEISAKCALETIIKHFG